MTQITLRILDGADQGRVLENLQTPVTIGREEGNVVQLNDERVSRFHLKIQEDQDNLVLTDLESTNGTKVNGEDVQLRILRHGDMIAVGRSVILFGSEDQIALRLAKLREADGDVCQTVSPSESGAMAYAASLDFELNWTDDPQLHQTLHALRPAELPKGLSPGQAAQLAELLEYLHIRIRNLLESVHVDDESEQVTLAQRQWQNLLDLQAQLTRYIREIGEPRE